MPISQINTNAIANNINLPGNAGIGIPSGNTAQRGAGTNPTIRYNTDTGFIELYTPSSNTWINSGTQSNSTFNSIIANSATISTITANTIYANTVYSEIVTNTADISWDSSTDTYTRSSGLATTQKITNIHLKMKRCLLKDDGSVNYYLNSANSALKADNTASDLTGASGMVMVEIPQFYVKYSRIGTINTWSISEVALPGYSIHPAFIKDGIIVNNRYIGAYDACVWTTGTTYQSGLNYDSNIGAGQNWNTGTAKLASVSGIYPAVGIKRSDARAMANNRGTGWRQVDFHLISAIQLLYLIEYGSFYSQSKIGNGNVQVATGYPASSGLQTDSPHSVAGKSNSIGNASGAVDSTVRDTAWCSYRGIENFWGNCWNWVDGININTNQAYVLTNNLRANLADDTASNYTQYGLPMVATNGYPTNILPMMSGFMPSAVGGSTTTYLTDYYYQTTGWAVAIFGGAASYGGSAGAFCWALSDVSSYLFRSIGARLAF